MKINLIFFLARFGFGGAGNSIYKLCRSLNKNKYKINIICLNKCAYENKLKKEGIKIFKIKSKRLLFSMLIVKNIVNKISKGFVKTILVSNINYTNALTSIFFNKTQTFKLIAIERTPLKELEIYFGIIDFIKKNLMKVLIYLFYGKFDKIVCNSKYLGDYLKKRYGFKSKIIFPPSISQKKVYFKKKFFKKRLYITTVCRLSKEKNIQDIIYAIKYLNQKNIILNIIGEGPDKKNLLELGKKLNIFKQIKFLGHKKNVFRYLSRTDLYVNSSYFEGFPNSVVEAAHMGIPIISSQSHGGINEILLRGKCGTIYKNDYFDLALKIRKFYNNPKAFYQKASLAKKNVRKFNVNNHIRSFEKLLNKI